MDGARAFMAEADQAQDAEPTPPAALEDDPAEVIGSPRQLTDAELEAELARRRGVGTPADPVPEPESPDDDDDDANDTPLPELPDGQFWAEDPETGDMVKFWRATGRPVWEGDILEYEGQEFEVIWPTDAQIAIFQGVGSRSLTPDRQTAIIMGYLQAVLSTTSFDVLLNKINRDKVDDGYLYTLMVVIAGKATELREDAAPANRRDRRSRRKKSQELVRSRAEGATVRTAAERQRALESGS